MRSWAAKKPARAGKFGGRCQTHRKQAQRGTDMHRAFRAERTAQLGREISEQREDPANFESQ